MARLNMRLHAQTDRDLIEWLDGQPDKTAAVKNAIRAVVGSRPDAEPAVVDLRAIRALFEAVLDERLESLARMPQAGDSYSPEEEDPDLAARLDAIEF